ncbi:MAG: type 4a pilus biogenesis protein PilO [Candidatus Shapirobacteria bacterium]|nr:type 4a pilus biogenesis protein PilO [Candidatus Shapirobacteria bacterium]MDD4410787.1 type 4a pilus biogenesis protein PilO [Candidatus Shapirobacteria bacterium]
MIDTKNWFQLRPMYSYIRKQAENEKFLKYLEIGGTFTLIAIFLFFAIMPTMTTIFSLMGDIKSKEAFIEKVDSKIANVIKAQESYAKVQEKYSLIEDSFPTLGQYYKGTSNLATIFKESSLDINQISLNLDKEENNKNQFYKSYQVNINGEGQYSSVLEMVKKIFNNRRLANTVNIKINQINSDSVNQANSKNIKISLSSDLYFLPNNNEKK